MSLLELFYHVDDFCQQFEPQWQHQLLHTGAIKRVKTTQLSTSEIMTILIHFHQAGYRDFKAYYTQHVQVHLRSEFPELVVYNRFDELMPRVLVPLLAYLIHCQSPCIGIAFVDSTPLAVCHNRRNTRHKVFAGLAAAEKRRGAGSSPSNSPSSSMTGVKSWLSASHPSS